MNNKWKYIESSNEWTRKAGQLRLVLRISGKPFTWTQYDQWLWYLEIQVPAGVLVPRHEFIDLKTVATDSAPPFEEAEERFNQYKQEYFDVDVLKMFGIRARKDKC